MRETEFLCLVANIIRAHLKGYVCMTTKKVGINFKQNEDKIEVFYMIRDPYIRVLFKNKNDESSYYSDPKYKEAVRRGHEEIRDFNERIQKALLEVNKNKSVLGHRKKPFKKIELIEVENTMVRYDISLQ